MSAETELLERFFDAINRNDMQAVAQFFDPGIVRIEPAGHPTAGTFRGISEVTEHVKKGRGTWAEGACEPERLLQDGNKVIVYLHARARLHGSSEWIGGRFADGFVMHGGKIAEYRTFWERPEALEWAGITDPAEE